MPRSGPITKLKRYTHLPALLHLLQTRSLTLLNPSTWPDQNDTTYLHRYIGTRPEVKALFALCMSEAADTFHHWSVYAGGPAGVKIDFDPPRFQEWLHRAEPSARLERVKYKFLDEIELAVQDTESLPFLKRMAFRDENEIRLLVEDHQEGGDAKYIPNFDMSTITRITLSPWLPAPLEDTVKRVVLQSCEQSGNGQHIEVRRTTLLYNKAFAEAGGES